MTDPWISRWAAAHKATTKHLTLKQQIAAVQQQIATLTAQAQADEAAAATL